MKKVVLMCAGGASTGMLVRKLNKAAEVKGLDYSFSATSVNLASTEGKKADVVLLGPQVAYRLEDVKKEIPGTPVGAIDMKDYGNMNVKKVFMQAMRLAGDKL